MKNKKLFILSPILLIFLTFLILTWINYFTNFADTNFSLVNKIMGICLVIVGIYLSVVLFLAIDDEAKNTFKDLIKDIGYVIGFSIAGLLVYGSGIYLISDLSHVDLFSILMYANYAFIVLYGLLTLRNFKKSERNNSSTFDKIKGILIILCSLAGIVVFWTKFNPILLIVSATLFAISLIIKLVVNDN